MIRDTDAGQFDNDTAYDRAVGPMQFIPSTWSVVGVDADGDGQRNPQDIDDAALATAVYLCSGDDDLSTAVRPARRGLPLQPLQSYVDLVLSIMDAYLAGDFMTVPDGTTAAGYLVPESPPSATPARSTATTAARTSNDGSDMRRDTRSTPSRTSRPTTTAARQRRRRQRRRQRRR